MKVKIVSGIILLAISVFCCRPSSRHNQVLAFKSLVEKGDIDGVSKMVKAKPWLLTVPLENDHRWNWKAFSIVAGRGQEAMASNLLALGADVNELDAKHFTILHHIASWAPNTNMIIFLLKHGADVRIKNDAGQTPFDIAVSLDKPDYIKELLSTNALKSELDTPTNSTRKGVKPN